MGNYRRSPRCRHCWQQGHTRNHCPEIKEAAAKGDTWAKNIVEQQKASVKNRECSYCREKGHNKRGCKSRKADRIIFDKICSRFQADRVKQLKEKGVTVGSLVSYKSSYGERKPTIAVITKITTENRVALWSWIEDKYSGIEAEETRAAFSRYYHNGFSNEHRHQEDISIKLESVTGNGLGYWGDSAVIDISSYEAFDLKYAQTVTLVSP